MVKKLKLLLSTGLLGLSMLCAFTALNVKTAKAEGDFKLVDGASIRLTEGDSGIRFMAEVSDTTKDYYMLIVPEDFLTSKNITNDFVTNLETEYPTQEFAKISCTPFEYLGKKVISASLVDLKDANYKRDFVGIAYYEEQGAYTYASYNDGKDVFSNARNIATVASAFLNDPRNADLTEKATIAKSIIDKAFLADDSSFGIKDESVNLTVGAKKTLEHDFSFELNIKYSSSDEAVAKVDANGVVSAVSGGNAVITAKIEGTEYVDTCAVTVKEKSVEDEKYSLFNFYDSDLLTGSHSDVSMNNGVVEISTTESSFIWLLRGKMCSKEIFDYYETITFVVKADKPCNFKYYTEQYDLNGANYQLAITSTSEYQEITFSLKTLLDNYDAFNNSLMVYSWGNGNNKVYIKDIYLARTPDKLSIFKIDETLLGSSGALAHSSVTYDATEKAIKVTGENQWAGRWMVASSKFAEAENLLEYYDLITFVVKNGSTAPITIHPYVDSAIVEGKNYFNDTWGKYDITINGQTDYVEYTFSATNFKTNIIGYKNAFMTWVGGLPSTDSIYIKDIYLSKAPDKLSVFKIDETLLGSSGGSTHSSVTYDATEKAIKVTGENQWAGRWMVASSKFAEAENLLEFYDSITFVVKNGSTATITIHPYVDDAIVEGKSYFNDTWGKYDITINGQTDYVEYTFSADNFKTNIIGYKNAFMTWVSGLPSTDSIYIKDIYLSK